MTRTEKIITRLTSPKASGEELAEVMQVQDLLKTVQGIKPDTTKTKKEVSREKN